MFLECITIVYLTIILSHKYKENFCKVKISVQRGVEERSRKTRKIFLLWRGLITQTWKQIFCLWWWRKEWKHFVDPYCSWNYISQNLNDKPICPNICGAHDDITELPHWKGWGDLAKFITMRQFFLLTGNNKSLVRPDRVDVPHPRSFVLDLTIKVAVKTRSQLSQLDLQRQTGDHNLSSIALWPVWVSLLFSPPTLTDWLGVVPVLVDSGRRTQSRGCTLPMPSTPSPSTPAPA